jgi:translation initiation factor 1A
MEHGMAKDSKPVMKRSPLPYKPKGEMFAVVREFTGGSRLIAMCEDDNMRMIRIPGKFKKKMWVRVHDVIIIKPWMVQSDSKGDLVYRYVKTERDTLIKKGKIPEKMII